MYELNGADYKAILDLVTSLVKVKSVSAFFEMLVNAKDLLEYDYVTLLEFEFHKTCTLNLIFSDDDSIHKLGSVMVPPEHFTNDRVFSLIQEGKEVIKTVHPPFFAMEILKSRFPDMNVEPLGNRTHHILNKMHQDTGKADLIIFITTTPTGSEKFDAMAGYLHAHLMSTYVRVMSVREELDGRLSERERSVLNWLKFGKTSWEVAKILDITENTVNFHIKNIKRKLNATNRQHAVAIAIAKGIID